MALNAIQSINLTDDNIIILFEKNWFQEDILVLSQSILKRIQNSHEKEVIKGADRENIRLLWLNSDFILNFDYYSQSCWLNAQDEIGTSKIQRLFEHITKNEGANV